MYIQFFPKLEHNQIILNKDTSKLYYNIDSNPYLIHFGNWKKEVFIELSDNIFEDNIGFPINFFGKITIPNNISFQIYFDETNIHLGPVISFLVNKNNLKSNKLKRFLGYFTNFQEINGLVYLFSIDGVNLENKTVKGYYYQPSTEENDEQFIKGIFPYPNVIYRRRRVDINSPQYKDLFVNLNGKIFNEYDFNKYEMWESLFLDPKVQKHLPQTKPLHTLQDLDDMLHLHETVYLKPVIGSFGRGIFTVKKTNRYYLFVNRKKKKVKILLDKQKKVTSLLRKINNRRQYLIQQSVAFTKENKHIDFRVIMQKDKNQKWKCSGIIARYGRIGNIHTNDASKITLGSEALQLTFSLTDEEIAKMEDEIISICTSACKAIEHSFGNYGDLGLDIIIDKYLDIWIIEINSLHIHSIAYYLADNLQMYHRIITQPLEYAKSLSNFKEK